MHRFWPRAWRFLAYTPPRRCDKVSRFDGACSGYEIGDFGHVSERSDRAGGNEGGSTPSAVGRPADTASDTALAALATAIWRGAGPARSAATGIPVPAGGCRRTGSAAPAR